MQCNHISELVRILREHGDEILNGSSKLCLFSSLISKMNTSLDCILNQTNSYSSSFRVLTNSSSNIVDEFFDLQLLFDFVQKTKALKILPDADSLNNHIVDISVFRNIKFLEIHCVNVNLIMGLRNLKPQLEFLICKHSINTLNEVLEYSGADATNGFVWNELKQAVFSYNYLDNLDSSLEFVPWLHSLDLSHNNIHDAHFLNYLPNLKYLNLSFNVIETLPSFTGQLCNNLQVFVLRHNYIDDIKELGLLVYLRELDLSHNCLIDHSCLMPLANLPFLRNLQLQKNPLGYHPQHRSHTAKYLHVNTLSREFLLENSILSKSEACFVGTLHPTKQSLFIDSPTIQNSFASNTPAEQSCVVDVMVICNNNNNNTKTTVTTDTLELEKNNWLRNEINVRGGQEMQDSGFVAEQRPASPSECSIGSAASMENDNLREQNIKNCESDIEVLSNPSQSSIEVLSCLPIARY